MVPGLDIICLEVKLAPKWNNRWEQPMRNLRAQKSIRVEKMIGVYTGNRKYSYDGVDFLTVTDLLSRLHQGEIF